ncbi:MAG: hypothetical protein ACLFR1_03910 [Spirochaetia bacterium]
MLTLEVRWFFQYKPFEYPEFFSSSVPVNRRIDWYLPVNTDKCGTKIRGSKDGGGQSFDTKMRRTDFGILSLGKCEGRVEEWEKWTAEFTNASGPPKSILETTGWHQIEKYRRLRVFRFGDTGIEEVTGDTENIPESGCHFEMTELHTQGNAWWTLGFEAYSPTKNLLEILECTIKKVLNEDINTGVFTGEKSFAYPAWLLSNSNFEP